MFGEILNLTVKLQLSLNLYIMEIEIFYSSIKEQLQKIADCTEDK